MNKQVRCAIYTRKSSEEGLEQSFNSLEAQREACVAYIQSQKHEGWVAIEDGYDDGGFSGGTMQRPALQQLLDDIRAGKVETVVVYKVDRLTRALSDFAKIIEVFDANKVSFVSVTQQFNTTTSMGRLTLNVLLSFAQFERELTGERIRDKIAASKKKGMWMGGVIPLGYDCAKRSLIVNESEAAIVREIFRQYVRLDSVMGLRDYLDQTGIRSKVRTYSDGRIQGGSAFSRGALYQILRNPIYTGKIAHHGQIFEGLHRPIVAQELWEQVARRLESNNRARRTRGTCSTVALLKGLLRDTKGVRFTPTHCVKGGKRYYYYTSQAAIQKRGYEPRISRYPADELDALVTGQIHEFLISLAKYFSDSATPDIEVALHRAKQLAADWPKLGVSRRWEFVRAVVSAVTVGDKSLWIDVDKSRALEVLHGRTEIAEDDQSPRKVRLTVDLKYIRRGVELRITEPGSHSPRKPTPSLVKAVARAHIWYEQVISGEVTGVKQIAHQSGLKCRYVRKILQSAVLSPAIVEAILEGRQAHDITLEDLWSTVPLDWRRQKEEML